MIKNILLLGANGLLGRAIAKELRSRHYRVRALVRSANKAVTLRESTPDIVIGNALKPQEIDGLFDHTDVVISAIGASVKPSLWPRQSYYDIDYEANARILEALPAHVKKFIYIGVFGSQHHRFLEYYDAHERFARLLSQAGIDYAVIRPTGLFGAFADILALARFSLGFAIGDGAARTNPIHEADVARICVDTLANGSGEIDVGGSEIYTRREIAELACRTVGKRPRILTVPARTVQAYAAIVKYMNPRLHALALFLAHVFTHDCVAPRVGSRLLSDDFAERHQMHKRSL